MFDKILIANRAEIACRIIRAARAKGVRSVAVYSDADADALHVQSADEAVHIGPPPATESYLCGDKIIAAALQTGAQAIHPGYGFLSENPDFVDAVTAAGLVFIGPTADAIRAMGLKDAAKSLMESAGVPVVPGYHGDNQDAEFLAEQADQIGYPVLIKARAGGGGKGMRLVHDPKDFAASLASAAREGASAFGDPAVLVEKYITSPRHIEVQVFGDSHGHVVHLYERDCSLQRRHQKVIEEAPAPGMTDAVRKAMTDAAVKAAQAIDYTSAGTIEFIVDGAEDLRTDGFWFMEMNTRLQVEHPVTEAITGVDLVGWQLQIAAGEALPLTQDQIPMSGHAFESRLYAEDPAHDFLPMTGKIDHLQFGDARIDTGVQSGAAISPYYDPMIAKIITHDTTRTKALADMTSALATTHVAGLTTNLRFLQRLCRHAGFAQGDVDTGLIARDLDALIAPDPLTDEAVALAVLVLSGIDVDAPFAGWRLWDVATHRCLVLVDGGLIEATISLNAPGAATVCFDDKEIQMTRIAQSDFAFHATFNGRRHSAAIYQTNAVLSVLLDGVITVFEKPDPLAQISDAAGTGDTVVAPMTGGVRGIMVAAGDVLAQGDPVMILEAMKMEHTLTAPRAGTVAEVLCATGDQVADGAVLLRLVADDTDA